MTLGLKCYHGKVFFFFLCKHEDLCPDTGQLTEKLDMALCVYKLSISKVRWRILGACWLFDLTISGSCSFRKIPELTMRLIVVREDNQHPSVSYTHLYT